MRWFSKSILLSTILVLGSCSSPRSMPDHGRNLELGHTRCADAYRQLGSPRWKKTVRNEKDEEHTTWIYDFVHVTRSGAVTATPTTLVFRNDVLVLYSVHEPVQTRSRKLLPETKVIEQIRSKQITRTAIIDILGDPVSVVTYRSLQTPDEPVVIETKRYYWTYKLNRKSSHELQIHFDQDGRVLDFRESTGNF